MMHMCFKRHSSDTRIVNNNPRKVREKRDTLYYTWLMTGQGRLSENT